MNCNTTNERAQVSRCAEPRLQTGMTDLTSESLWAFVLAAAMAPDYRVSPPAHPSRITAVGY